MPTENIASRNIQRHAYQLTINNPLDYNLEHAKIKEILIVSFSTLKYFCMADEIGEQGTFHTHIYVVFSSRVRWSTIKKHFEHAHIEVAHGSAQSNLDYIKKTGKWEDTDKAETTVEGSFEEWGEFPRQRGFNQDMKELYDLVKDGYSNAEILSINNDYILQIDKLDKLRTTILIEKFKNERRLELKVIYVYGETGLGKTRDILDRHGDANVYRISDYTHPFDSYDANQTVMCFDEFRSQIRISDMLNYCDIYPIQLPARYANKFACYNVVYIVSNWKLEQQYEEVQQDSPESWKAFLRRIHEVHIYNVDGTITIYDSVNDYFNRDEKIRTISKEEEQHIPFN